jgi:hypothetical protein
MNSGRKQNYPIHLHSNSSNYSITHISSIIESTLSITKENISSLMYSSAGVQSMVPGGIKSVKKPKKWLKAMY